MISAMSLRPAILDDAATLFHWANDPETRRVSFSSQPITWEEHVSWLTKRLAVIPSLFYLAVEENGAPIGTVRYDREPSGRLIVSITIAPERRGQGAGAVILRLGAEQLYAAIHPMPIYAYIKPDNMPSIRAFTKAEFSHAGVEIFKGYEIIVMKRMPLGEE